METTRRLNQKQFTMLVLWLKELAATLPSEKKYKTIIELTKVANDHFLFGVAEESVSRALKDFDLVDSLIIKPKAKKQLAADEIQNIKLTINNLSDTVGYCLKRIEWLSANMKLDELCDL